MAGPVRISVKDLSAKAKSSVSKALDTHVKAFPRPNYIFGFVPPWWIGIVLNNPIETLTVADANKLAADIHGGVGPAVAALKGTRPGVMVGPGHIICGFIAPPEIVLEE
jgi:hypothetical protein